MKKSLAGINGKKALKVFIKAGGVERKGKGDHKNVKMPNGQLVTLPQSKELKIGLLKSVIKKAGMTEEEFLELL
jgi:predicted RNA binding protein YcfA (HicA-like mRNA interferase family)